MAVSGSKVTVSAAGVKVADSADTDSQAGVSVLCIMEGTGPCYVAGNQAAAVANATGTQGRWDKAILAALSVSLQPGEELWMATASSTCVVQVIKTGG